jgi:hypothetical protein
VKLSIVVTSDRYDDLLALSLNRNLKSLPEAEFIFVEYGARFGEVCKGLYRYFRDRIRYYSVQSFNSNESKNIGIRRAFGDFIISMDSDLILSPELVAVLKKGMVRQHVIYRTCRVEIKNDHRYVLFPIPSKFIIGEGSGTLNDFMLMDRGMWKGATGYCETGEISDASDFLIWVLGQRGIHVESIGKVIHWDHSEPVPGSKEDFKNIRWRENGGTWGLSLAKETMKDGIIYLE